MKSMSDSSFLKGKGTIYFTNAIERPIRRLQRVVGSLLWLVEMLR